MKTFAFVYSRTKNHDYRVLSDLSEAVCPREVRNCFENRIVAITNDVDSLELSRWLFIKEKGYALWGIACMNEMLDSQYSKDKIPRELRGFTGYVIPNYSSEPLASEINVFKEIFRKVMAPIFDGYVQEQLTDVLIDVSNVASFVRPKPFDNRLNVDYHKCRVFSPTVDAESLVASCLSYPDDISIAINVARIESVTTPRFNPLMNAVMREAMPEEITDIPVKHLCGNCGKAVDDLIDGLCLDCWNTQHPRCSRCGVETSQLHEGLCQDCWDLNNASISMVKENSHSHKMIQDDMKSCRRCGKKTTNIARKGRCEACERHHRTRLWIIGVVLVALLSCIAIGCWL